VKIADFGLVRAIAEAGITSASVILGTAAYLSPEQVSTGNAGPCSDVYAVGILAFELLTGVTPFTADTALAVAYQRMDNDVAAPSTVIGGVPPQFDDLVLSATSRDPADRYADALEMAAELDAIVDELGLPAFRVPAPRNSAQHMSAALYRSQINGPGAPPAGGVGAPPAGGGQTTDRRPRPPAPAGVAPHHPTRELTRGPDDWPPNEPHTAEFEEYQPVTGQFAGIDMSEFHWARQRARRAVWFWVAAILIITGTVGATAWTIGSNLGGLIQR
jgi:serine/threonine protein kinase, bacterial